MLANLEQWIDCLTEIEHHAPSDNGNGNKLRALKLLRDMERARVAIRRLLDE